MFTLFCRTLVFWMVVFELLVGWRRWWGLSWLGQRRVYRRMLPFAGLALIPRRPLVARGLMRALLPGLLLQIVASSLRNRKLNPLLQLRPGQYEDRTITRLAIPMSQGYLPALHVAPRTSTDAAICIVHGSGCDKTFYIWPLVDVLLAHNLAVLLIDLDGHGENPRLQSFPAMTEDVVVAVEWLHERYRHSGLIGMSLGGCVAARAVADGVAVDRLALLAAPPLLHYTRADVWHEAMALVRLPLLNLFTDCSAYHLVRAWQTAPIRATIGTADLIAALDLCGSLARIDLPLLLLYGARDAIVRRSQAEQVRRAMPPGETFVLVPHASHLSLQLNPSALQTLGTWFAEMVER